MIVNTEDDFLKQIKGMKDKYLYAFIMADAIRYGVNNVAKGYDKVALSVYSDKPAKGAAIIEGVLDLLVKPDTQSLGTHLNIPNSILTQLILARNKLSIPGMLDSLGQFNGFLGNSKENITLSTPKVVIVMGCTPFSDSILLTCKMVSTPF